MPYGVVAGGGADTLAFGAFFAASLLAWEAVAGLCAGVAAAVGGSPVVAAACYVVYTVNGLMFGGVVVGERDLVGPLKVAHWATPYTYQIPTLVRLDALAVDYDACDAYPAAQVCFCGAYDAPCGGRAVLRRLRSVMPVVSHRDRELPHAAALLALAAAAKAAHLALRRFATAPTSPPRPPGDDAAKAAVAPRDVGIC